MTKKLIVVTKLFPYNYTETFLESETPYLQKVFKNIIFMPLYKGKIRPNFSNLIVDDSYNKLYSKKKRIAIRVLFSVELYKSLIFHRRLLFHKNMFLSCIKQQIHRQIIKQIIKKNPSTFTEETTIYSYWFNAPVYAFISLREKYGLKYSVVCRAHRWDVYDENGEMPYRKYCIENIDKIFPISQDACNYFWKKYGHNDKYVLARLGVQKRNATTRASTKNNFHVLTISQLIKRKRVDLALEAIVEFAIRNKDLNIKWIHFGTGELENKLKEKILSINITNLNIQFMGYVPNTEILKFLESATIDVFINLSSSEGVPVSIMEVQSYGIPVIATNVGGSGEIINENNGILLSPNPNINDVVTAMEKVYKSNYNREIIKKYWNKMSNAQTNFQYFASLLSKQ